jgi:uncharacterized damage-inducible protein DinB
MPTSEKTNSFLEEARKEAAALHQSIEQGVAGGETQMRAALDQSSARANDLAKTLKSKADTADAALKAKLTEAAAHADAVAKSGQSGRPRPMLDEAQKLTHSISDAVAHVRAHGATGAQK